MDHSTPPGPDPILAQGMGLRRDKAGHKIARGSSSSIHTTGDCTQPCVEVCCTAAVCNPTRKLAIWMIPIGYWQWKVTQYFRIISIAWTLLCFKIQQELRLTWLFCGQTNNWTLDNRKTSGAILINRSLVPTLLPRNLGMRLIATCNFEFTSIWINHIYIWIKPYF